MTEALARVRVPWFLVALVTLGGCAEVPADRYGVGRLHLEGVEEMDEYALRACLATAQRERFDLNLGRSTEPACNEAPFDATFRPRLPLWKWPWTDWPLYDRNVFERDLQRVERWYRARGYYDAHVTASVHEPPAAASSDRVNDETVCDRVGDGEGCELDLTIRVEEGEPILVQTVTMDGLEHLRGTAAAGELTELEQALHSAWRLEPGDRFDEALYDQSKKTMLRALHDAGLGCATVTGDVAVDPTQHRGDIRYTVEPGPPTYIGNVDLTGYEDLDATTIRAVADIDEGDLYTDVLLDSARHSIYALGAFASVEIGAQPRRDEDGSCTIEDGRGTVDVAIRVTPGRRLRYGFGVGLQTGQQGIASDSPVWDIHLLGFVEHRNFLGGLRRARFEARPKLIFLNQFPNASRIDDGGPPRPGIELRLELRQPAFIERRTTGIFTTRYDFGPDPFSYFFRHDLDSALAIRRNFFDGRLSASLGVHFNLYRVSDDTAVAPPSDYQLIFFEQLFQLDLRDDTRRPTKGAFFGIEAHEAVFLTWDYIRLTPDARAYVPLGPLVLAGRFRLGWLKIIRARSELDPVSDLLGPQRYRLRGGGANSHRGFLPGFLGDAAESAGTVLQDMDGDGVPERANYTFLPNSGGLRRWEASLELRAPLSEDFGLVFFADMGDVNRAAKFRFTHLHLALGFGLRYQTIIGPFRVDFGFLIPGAQVVGQAGLDHPNQASLGFVQWAGAIHLTIGEAF